MSAHHKHWHLREPAPPELAECLGCSQVIATLLHQRELCEPDAVSEFLHAEYPSGLHDPFLMKGMSEASERIGAAITNREPMAVYGDFDTDGVTAVALLQQALTAMGHTIRRARGGYGGYQAIMWDAVKKVYFGASESRKDGHAAGY